MHIWLGVLSDRFHAKPYANYENPSHGTRNSKFLAKYGIWARKIDWEV
jgi:hypothetical protein